MSDTYPEGSGPQANDAGRGPGQRTADALGEAGRTVAQEAAHFAEAARETVQEKAQAGQKTAANALGAFADAIRKAGEDLSDQDQTAVAQLARQAAQGLEGLSRSLSDKDPADLLHAVRDFGRSNPAAFMAGSVLAGLALGRFVRSSAEHGRPSAQPPEEAMMQGAESPERPDADGAAFYEASVDEAVGGDAGVDALSGDELNVEATRG